MSDHLDDLEPDETWPLAARFRGYGASHAQYLAVSLAFAFVGQFVGRAPPVVIGATVDGLADPGAYRLPVVPAAWIPADPERQLLFTGGLLVGLFGVHRTIGYVSQYLRNVFAIELLYDLKMDAYETVQGLEVSFFESQQTGEVLSVLNNDVDQLETFYNYVVTSLVVNSMSLVAMAVYMTLLNPQLTVVAFVLAPAFTLVNIRFKDRIQAVFADVRRAVGKLNARFQDNVRGMAVIKANTAEQFESGRVHETSRRTFDTHWEALKLQTRFRPVTTLLSNGTFLLTFIVGGYWVLHGPPGPLSGTLTAGNLVTFLLYTQQLSGNLGSLSGHVERYKTSKASARRLSAIQRADLIIEDRADARDLDRVRGRVEYDDVTFAYDGNGDGNEGVDGDDGEEDEPVLRDVTFAAEAGETVGLVGPTGAGKSTLTKLLLRFYDVDEGSIRVDGHDVRDVTVRSLRASIGYVAQEPHLFSGTVRENIAYGASGGGADPRAPGVTDREVREAARAAQAHAFIERLEDGYDTEVGERGVKLSGGQRQRIAIARALVRDPPILVFDEATSHVDNETEVLIQRSLDEITEDRTTFVVAHRLSTVRNADTILVMDDGGVAERGSHEELLDEGGIYASLWGVQVGQTDHSVDLDPVDDPLGS